MTKTADNSCGEAAVASTAAAAAAQSAPAAKQASQSSDLNHELSVDTTFNINAHIKQQDSGSNQSGSDSSGLGTYASSLSSDSSTALKISPSLAAPPPPPPPPVTTLAPAAPSAALPSSPSAASPAAVAAAAAAEPLANLINDHDSKHKPKRHGADEAINQSHCVSIGRSNSGLFDKIKSNSDLEPNRLHTHAPAPDKAQLDRPGSHHHRSVQLDAQNGSEKVAISNDREANTNQSGNAPVIIRSLLKKPANSNTGAPLKHNKTVSFNQTVIVFCEEIEAPSPTDQYDPPVDYQDQALEAFDPPKGYCDPKKEDRGDPKVGGQNRIIGNAPNLDDAKIIGIFDNESIIDAFNLSCDDLSEEDFPINYLNSNHGFLCDDAVSDYDSDSESSLSTERKVASNKLKNHPNHGFVDPRPISDEPSEKPKATIQPDNPNLSPPGKSNESKQAAIHGFNPGKSLPARMKVTQVDSNLVKRHTKVPENNDLKRDQHESAQIEPSPMVHRSQQHEPSSVSSSGIILKPHSHDHQVQSTNSTGFLQNPNESKTFNHVIRTEPHNQTRLLSLTQANQSDRDDQRSIQPQPACHVCRAIESNKLQSHCGASAHLETKSAPAAPKPPELVSHEKPAITQPVVFNQSCVSCRDALIRQNIIRSQNLEPRPVNAPLTYQIVYALDSNGNRVRALSLVRPPVADSAPRNLGNDNRVGPIGPVSIRLPNPGLGSAPRTNWQHQNAVHLPQYRLIRATNLATTRPAADPEIPINTANLQIHSAVPNPGLRHHTVYYVRKPLEAKESCQSAGHAAHNVRAFPDPHEVRRLDGLRAPINQPVIPENFPPQGVHGTPPNMERFANQKKASENVQDETDDPTFGFSKRPAVKVVATSSSAPMNHTQVGLRRYDPALGVNDGRMVTQNSTQTLNRRQLPMHYQNRALKENIPCTTSLSNINSLLTDDPHCSSRSTQGPAANSAMRVAPNGQLQSGGFDGFATITRGMAEQNHRLLSSSLRRDAKIHHEPGSIVYSMNI